MYYVFEYNCIGIMTINSEYKGTIVTMTRLYCRLEDSPFAGDIVILYLKGVKSCRNRKQSIYDCRLFKVSILYLSR